MSGVGGVTPCPECQTCEADDCGTVAYCLADHAAHPCPHDRTLCGDCILTHCPDCQQDIEVALRGAIAYRDSLHDTTPEPDPWGPLAEQERRKNERFWNTVGDRSHLKGKP